MTVVGCTGHQSLSRHTRAAIRDAISARLRQLHDDDLEGICSLAVGADQVFARALLATGGDLHVIVPSADYASTFQTPEDRANYTELLACSASSEELPFAAPTERAFMAAGREVADRSDVLFAIWDGAPAAGLGGTADIVRYAKDHGKPVEVIWPQGARRR